MNGNKDTGQCLYVSGAGIRLVLFLQFAPSAHFQNYGFGASVWKGGAVNYHMPNSLSLVSCNVFPRAGKQMNSTLPHLSLRQFISRLV
jgi:hypothetical protein